jgi:uncharacterized protein (TIGR03435 family)
MVSKLKSPLPGPAPRSGGERELFPFGAGIKMRANESASKDLFPVSRRGGNIPVETMSERDDQLIAEFNARRSEEAFAALVRQHVNLVFATVLRQVGDAGAAEEITQNVFVALAQAAGKLGSHPTIAGWLHQTALNKSREWLRSELRRRKREQVAVNLDLARAEGDSVWSSLVPLLDEALLELREPDRLAVILHFMEGQTFQEVGSALGIGEDTARKRVNRCLGQLTHFFRRRGFAAPALVAGAPLFTLSSHAAPAGLAASATTAGLAAAHSAATSTLTLIKGALKIMAWTKAKTAVVTGVVVLLAAGTATITVKEIQEQRTYPWQIALPNSDEGIKALDTTPPQVTIVRSKFSANQPYASLRDDILPKEQWRYIGIHATPSDLVIRANQEGFPLLPSQIVFPSNMPDGFYDFIANLTNNSQQALQALIRKKFGLVGKYEMRDMDVLLLKVEHPNAPGLKPGTPQVLSGLVTRGLIHNKNISISRLAFDLGWDLQIPVIDQTGLVGNYDFDFPENLGDTPAEKLQIVRQWLFDQLGLELAPTNMPVETLVVERAKN